MDRIVEFDPEARVAIVEPGVRGRELNGLLADHGLFFPSGHCPTVGLGGFLLQGGWGWLSRVIGPACLSVIGVDVVTATGELIHADAEQNAGLAVGGAGRGRRLLRGRGALLICAAIPARRRSGRPTTSTRWSCATRC